MPREIPFKFIILWILALAAVAVGARNFEDGGLTVDAPLYASIGRHIVQQHEWFSLYGGTPDLKPFADHPHLGYWVLASVFKVAGTADWVARIPGHLFYVAFLAIFFYFVRLFFGQKTAIWSVLFLWSFGRFSNHFSNVFLDPGALFFGTLGVFASWKGLETKEDRLAVLGGLSFALCALYKGMIVLGFGPAWLLLVFHYRRNSLRFVGIEAACGTLLLGIYCTAILFSNQPDFLQLYFHRQLFSRVGNFWRLHDVLALHFWKSLFVDSNYLLPLVLLGIRRWNKLPTAVPVTLLLTFCIMYSSMRLGGGQYLITLLPWVALLVGEQVARWKWNPAPLVPITAGIAITALFLLQYFPVRLHGTLPPPEKERIQVLKSQGLLKELYVDAFPERTQFGTAATYAWYANLETLYPDLETVPSPQPGRFIVLLRNEDERTQALRKRGWCQDPNSRGNLWGNCPRSW